MDEKTSGLILRTRPLTETSLIVHWLTPDLGRIATVAKGARRPKSPFRGKLDLFHLADFSIARSRRSDLHILREITLRELHRPLREDIHLLQQAAYCAQLVEQTTETESPLPELHQLMLDLLGSLPKMGASPVAIFAFEMKLLAESGLQPDTAQINLRPGTREILHRMVESGWNLITILKLSPAQTIEIRQFLHDYLLFHLGRIPHSRATAVGDS